MFAAERLLKGWKFLCDSKFIVKLCYVDLAPLWEVNALIFDIKWLVDTFNFNFFRVNHVGMFEAYNIVRLVFHWANSGIRPNSFFHVGSFV